MKKKENSDRKGGFSIPNIEKYRIEVEKNLVSYMCQAQHYCYLIVLISQALMMTTMLLKAGGPFFTMRRRWYFFMYVTLFSVTIIVLIGDDYIRKRWPHRHHAYLNLSTIYMAFLCFWSCGLTLIDQLGGNGLSVFSYMLIAVAAFSVLKLWQSLLIFGASFIVLNLFLPFFQSGMNNLFSNIINSFFITALAVLISAMLYRFRVMSYYDKLVIQQQYEEIKSINEQLNHDILVDDLTGLYNRRFLDDVLKKRADDHLAQGKNLSVMMIDVDFFKQYNDHYGHLEGDLCLRQIAQVIKGFAESKHSYAIRYGGEEFLICMFDVTLKTAEEIAQELCLSVKESHLKRDDVQNGAVTISIGVSSDGGMKKIRLDELINHADQALYTAKKEGRNRVMVYHAK